MQDCTVCVICINLGKQFLKKTLNQSLVACSYICENNTIVKFDSAFCGHLWHPAGFPTKNPQANLAPNLKMRAAAYSCRTRPGLCEVGWPDVGSISESHAVFHCKGVHDCFRQRSFVCNLG
jgi:hypothetical protein